VRNIPIKDLKTVYIDTILIP